MTTKKQRIIVGITGASGTIYAVRLLQVLRKMEIETHLVMTKAAEQARAIETRLSAKELRDLADVYYSVNDIGATIASGSLPTLGMIIAPCTVNTVAAIAHGITTNLLTRAADVVLKERRHLVLMVRESPLNTVHLKNMLAISEMGGIIAPPVPAFYTQPKQVDDIINQTVGRTLDLFGLESSLVERWI